MRDGRKQCCGATCRVGPRVLESAKDTCKPATIGGIQISGLTLCMSIYTPSESSEKGASMTPIRRQPGYWTPRSMARDSDIRSVGNAVAVVAADAGGEDVGAVVELVPSMMAGLVTTHWQS